MQTIVVGVDGSKAANGALEFAAAEAALRGARLRVVSAWHIPAEIFTGYFVPASDTFDTFDTFREGTEKIVSEAVATVRRLQPEIECEGTAVEGQPAEVLIQQAAGATLLVVGNRGLGGFSSLLLGSVSQQVVHHTPCPVVIIPHGESSSATSTARRPG
jgi:nucleotide-binding universal stress UspA family protein